MTKPPKDKAKSEHRHQSGDDRALWQRVADTITPMGRKARDHARVPVGGADQVTPMPSQGQPVPTPPAQRNTRSPVLPKQPHQPTQQPVRPPEPKGLAQTDARRLRSGRIAIEARLDLHGMRQGEAHGALKRFLLASQQRGLRWVLVITGKGGRTDRTADARDFDGTGGRVEPGVLRQNVPRWLQEPELRPIVIGFQEAAPQHGGHGALYINLRRGDRVKKFET